MELKRPDKQAHRTGKFSDITPSERESYADLVNGANLGWKADSYNNPLMVVNLAQTQSRQSRRFADGSADFAEALGLAQKFLDIPLEEIRVEDLESQWSWEDLNGYDFTGRVIDQGHCGSCFLMATNGMIESRIKI